MRIDAVQNERRPYTSHTTNNNKHELLASVINNQRLRKQNDTTSLNTVRKKILK